MLLFPTLFFVLGRFSFAAFVSRDGRRLAHEEPRLALHLFRGLKGLPPLSPAHRESVAEVCRNRTDRSRIARPAGFEAPDGHQPACTSGLILDEGNLGVNLEGGQKHKRRVAVWQQLAPREKMRYFVSVKLNGMRQSP